MSGSSLGTSTPTGNLGCENLSSDAFGTIEGKDISLPLFLLNLAIRNFLLLIIFLWAYLEVPKQSSEVEKAWILALREERVSMKETTHCTGCGEATSRLPPPPTSLQ